MLKEIIFLFYKLVNSRIKLITDKLAISLGIGFCRNKWTGRLKSGEGGKHKCIHLIEDCTKHRYLSKRAGSYIFKFVSTFQPRSRWPCSGPRCTKDFAVWSNLKSGGWALIKRKEATIIWKRVKIPRRGKIYLPKNYHIWSFGSTFKIIHRRSWDIGWLLVKFETRKASRVS